VLGRSPHVGDDETDARIKLARMPLDLGHHTTRFLPALSLIAEARMEAPHLVRRAPNRSIEQIADLLLQDPVCGQPNRILDLLAFQKLIQLRHGERSVTAE